jgi:two-component system NarL family sensor kinase
MIVATITTRDAESNRVSRILHDDVGQVLTGVGLLLGVLKLDFQKDIPEIIDRINEIQQMLDQAVQQVRALSYDLNPSIVERAGLQLALERLIGRYREEFTGSLRYMNDSSVRVPIPVGNAWYKIAELALENALKHAEATRIEVHVRRARNRLSLEVRDNGKGFSLLDAKINPRGLGLLLIEHHAASCPITVEVKSVPGKGTTLRSVYDLPVTEHAAKSEPKGRDSL